MSRTAASVTTPRSPAQPTTRVACQGTEAASSSSLSRRRRKSEIRIRKTQAIRSTMTVASTATQKPAICQPDSEDRAIAAT